MTVFHTHTHTHQPNLMFDGSVSRLKVHIPLHINQQLQFALQLVQRALLCVMTPVNES